MILKKNIFCRSLLFSFIIFLSTNAYGSTSLLATSSQNKELFFEQAEKIFVQAGKGSFNHQAINLLFKEMGNVEMPEIIFCGTPLNAMEKAEQSGNFAFMAVENTIVPGNLIFATIEALRQFAITEISAGVNMKIKQCLIRNKRAIETNAKLRKIASHPAALRQINVWKTNKNLEEIPVEEGTSAAAKSLSKEEYLPDVGVIGSSVLAEIYNNLTVTEEGIQDSDNNFTLFGLFQISRRKVLVSTVQATQALQVARDVLQIQIKVDRLFGLMKKRLLIMHNVAQWKWNHRQPIKDLSREKQLLNNLVEKGIDLGLDREYILTFFQAQIEAAKMIQEKYFKDWEDKKMNIFENVPNLKLILRPQLDELSTNLLEALRDISPLIDQVKVQEIIQSRANHILKGHGIDDAICHKVIEPLN